MGLLAAAAMGCEPKLSRLDGAKISCGPAERCPAGLVCKLEVGLCVPEALEDFVSPGLAPETQARITPSIGKKGTQFTVAFRVNKPLGRAPEVLAQFLGRPPAPLTLEATELDGLGYSFAYTATGEEPEGTSPLYVNLVDTEGNRSQGLPLGYLSLDFTAPSVVSASANPSSAKLGDKLIYTVNVSERLRAGPDGNRWPSLVVRKDAAAQAGFFVRSGGDEGPVVESATGFSYLKQIEPGLDGEYTVELLLVDEAGNESGLTAAEGFVIDAKTPQVCNLVVEPARAKAGSVVKVSFEIDEPLAASGLSVTLGGVPMEQCGAVSSGPARYECTEFLDAEVAPATEKTQAVLVRATDAAGNRGEAEASLVFDFKEPGAFSLAVAYSPALGSLLSLVKQATVGSTITVLAVADERLDANVVPMLTASNGTDTLVFTTQTHGESSATFSVTVPSGYSSGTYLPALQWTDLAGNQAQAAQLPAGADSIELRTSAPALVVAQQQVRYVRSPWGSATEETLDGGFVIPSGPYFALAPSEPLEGTELPGTTFGFAGLSQVRLVRIWSAAVNGTLLGTMAPLPSNAWPRLRLAVDEDVPTVYVTGVDEAGNESAAMKIENAEWVATPKPAPFKAAPHRLEWTPFAEQTLTGGAAGLRTTDGGVEGRDGMAALAQAEAVWRRRQVSDLPMPSRRADAAMAFDAARGRIVLFGGLDESSRRQDTWEWDGTSWEQRTPAGPSPSARIQHGMAYDAARDRVVLFGGLDAGGHCQDTWEWNGTNWVNVTPSPPGPSARAQHAMAYDARRGRIVLFGGDDGSRRQDTWEWDGTSWVEQAPTNFPGARAAHAMAFDAARGVVVLFGGQNGSAPLQDTWEWDGVSWGASTPSGQSPSARHSLAMTYDSTRGRVVLSGGNDGSFLGDTWEWDGASWEEIALAGARPAARSAHSMAFDGLRGQLVLFGGEGADGTLQDTWEWDGTSWVDQTPADSRPSVRNTHGMAYDSARNRVVLFGGYARTPTSRVQDTWEWDGTGWTDRTPAGPKPSARESPTLVFDSARGRVVLFGGFDATGRRQDTWEWDGTHWVEKTPAGAIPPPRFGHAMAYDVNRGRVVLFGGSSATFRLQDTWEWDGAQWTQLTSAGSTPGARSNHSMAYDSARGRVVLFGGFGDTGRLQDTWEWDGASWVDRTPAGTLPSARNGHAMAYDSLHGRVVLFGGNGSSGFVQDTWEWDGTSWLSTAPPGSWPSARQGSALAFDSARGRLVLFGGTESNTGWGPRGDTWEWDGTRWEEKMPAARRPPRRYGPAMAYDCSRERTVLFGGQGLGYYADTWEWDGRTWTDRTTTGAKPGARISHAMAYDLVRDRIVLFGGYEGTLLPDTWEWSLAGWQEVLPAGSKPSARRWHAMAFDSDRGHVVLFGGYESGGASAQDTWAWDGTNWQVRTPAGLKPSQRRGQAMAYDSARGRVVLFGGYLSAYLQDTWEWDGTNWMDVTPTGANPSARSQAAMTYDSVRGRTILFGGANSTGPLQDTWEWDGASWVNTILVGNKPGPRTEHAMVFDEARGRVVVAGGGISTTDYVSDTWELDAAPERQPAIQFRALGAAVAASSIDEVRVRAQCGAHAPLGASADGAELWGWTNGLGTTLPPRWAVLPKVNTAGLSPSQPMLADVSASLIDWSSLSPAEARRFYLERDGSLAFQCRPRGSSGLGAAEAAVALDYVEVRVRYQAP